MMLERIFTGSHSWLIAPRQETVQVLKGWRRWPMAAHKAHCDNGSIGFLVRYDPQLWNSRRPFVFGEAPAYLVIRLNGSVVSGSPYAVSALAQAEGKL